MIQEKDGKMTPTLLAVILSSSDLHGTSATPLRASAMTSSSSTRLATS